MLKKTITCEDFDGNTYTEDYWFHLNKTELAELNLGKKDGFYAFAQKLIKEDTDENREKILEIYRDLILRSFGKKSADGRRFVKSPEMSKEFSETNAFEKLYMELISDEKALAEFFNGVLPKDMGKITPEMIEQEKNKISK